MPSELAMSTACRPVREIFDPSTRTARFHAHASRWATIALLATCAGLTTAASAGPPPRHHVVLIVVDGLRPETIEAAPARNVQKLAAEGTASRVARAVGIPETLPGHVTMVTGLAPRAHGVTYNTDRGATLNLPTVFTRVREAGGVSALYLGKSKLAMLAAPGTAAIRHGPGPNDANWPAGEGRALAAQFAQDFAVRPFHFTLIHLREPDIAGHEQGWMSKPYLAAVREADAAVGQVIAAIAATLAADSTTVLLTSDHGGHGTSHHARDGESVWRVPWLCRTPGGRSGAVRESPTLLDVAPTVLALLGLPALPDAQGHAVAECLPR